MQASLESPLSPTPSLDHRFAACTLRVVRLARTAHRLATHTLLTSVLLVRCYTSGASAQELDPSDRLRGPLELWGADGATTAFPNEGQYFFPEGSSAWVPGLGWFTEDVQIPKLDGTTEFDLRFVPFDEIPMSDAGDSWLDDTGDGFWGGAGAESLFGGGGNDDSFGAAGYDTDLLDTYEQNGGSFFDSIDGLTGDIDFINPQRDSYDPFAEEGWPGTGGWAEPGGSAPGLESWDEQLGW